MNKKRKILCITGTRADYPRVKSVLKEINQRPNLELQLIVTGSHLLKEYGYSAQEIIDDGYKIDRMIQIFSGDYNSPLGMTKAAAKCTEGIADALSELNPDLVLLTVDRIETLGAAVAVSLMNFPIAHIQGGEVTGTIDESIRHAVTKLSHIHFPATADAAERIVRMGEKPNSVFQFGCPYIDIINSVHKTSKNELSERYGFSSQRPLIIFTQHAVTTEFGSSMGQIQKTLDALKSFNYCEILAFFSNTDAGGKEIIEAIKKEDNFTIIPNMVSSDFLSLMACADVMVGNSSAAIREAPSFQLPAINIGTRQQGRLRAVNVIDVNHEKNAIIKAIDKALNNEIFKTKVNNVINPYGDGNSATKIVDVLEDTVLDEALVQKRIAYEL